MGSNYQSFYGLLFFVAVLGILFFRLRKPENWYAHSRNRKRPTTENLLFIFHRESNLAANYTQDFVLLYLRSNESDGEFLFGPFHPFWFQLFPFRCWLLCLSISSFVHWFRRFSVCLFAECTRGRIKCILHRRTDQTRTGSHDLGSNVKGITEPGNDIWDHKTFFQANFLKHANHLARVCLPYVEWSSFVIISIEWQ